MPSSISSSDLAIPGGRWLRTWVVALVLAGCAVAALELKVRGMGYRPSVVDDEYLWAIERGRVANGDPRTIALLGASRIQLAADLDELERRLPGWTVAQLAIDGTAPVAALRDLAEDDDFRGVAVVDISGWMFVRSTWDSQRSHVAVYHQPSPGLWLNRWLAARAQSRLALLGAAGRRFLTTWLHRRKWPPAIYVQTHPNRSRDADYTLANVDAMKQRRIDRIAASSARQRAVEPWLEAALALDAFVEPIQRRGGQVVFVRMPTCGEHLAHTESRYPKPLFWDAMAARTRAKTIHFLDYASLRDFECPDLSHIDQRDKRRFSTALVDALVDVGAIAAAGVTPRSR